MLSLLGLFVFVSSGDGFVLLPFFARTINERKREPLCVLCCAYGASYKSISELVVLVSVSIIVKL